MRSPACAAAIAAAGAAECGSFSAAGICQKTQTACAALVFSYRGRPRAGGNRQRGLLCLERTAADARFRHAGARHDRKGE